MSKNIRQKIAHAIQTTFRSSSSSQDKQTSSIKSKIATCCSVSKPKDYEFIPYQPKQTSAKDDYVDLSECHSWSSSSSSRDSGISFDTNISSVSSSNQNIHQQLQSTKTYPDEACSFLTLSDLSYIPHDQMNISKFDISECYPMPTSFQCCHCQCHHHINTELSHKPTANFLYVPEQYREKRIKKEIFPYIL